jgi:hypothetical protein
MKFNFNYREDFVVPVCEPLLLLELLVASMLLVRAFGVSLELDCALPLMVVGRVLLSMVVFNASAGLEESVSLGVVLIGFIGVTTPVRAAVF